MNRAHLFEGRVDDRGRLIDWHDGVVLAVYGGDPPLLLGLLAWYIDLGIRVYALVPVAATEYGDIMRLTQNLPCGPSEWQEARELVKAIISRHAGPIDVLVTDERHVLLEETKAEQDEVARSLPFDAEAAFGKHRLEIWHKLVVDLAARKSDGGFPDA